MCPKLNPPPPALGGITMEAVERDEVEKRPGIDVPLQSAPFGLRVLAALVDGIVIAAASALFGYIFWKVADVRPPQVSDGGPRRRDIPCIFWAAYQYLLIVYSASTPGLTHRTASNLPLRRHFDQPLAAPLARTGFLPLRRFAGDGICLGLPGRRRTLLARPDHAHLPGAEEAESCGGARTEPEQSARYG